MAYNFVAILLSAYHAMNAWYVSCNITLKNLLQNCNKFATSLCKSYRNIISSLHGNLSMCGIIKVYAKVAKPA